MSMLTDDLAAIHADTSLSVEVVFGTSPVQNTRGFLSTEDVPESDGAGGIVMVNRRTIGIQEGSLSDVASGDTITVDGVVYTIHGRPRGAGSGRTKLVLAEGS